MILGMVNTRQSAAVTLDPPSVIPAASHGSFEEMLANELTFLPSHQPHQVKFADTVPEDLTTGPYKFQEKSALPTRPASENHPEETRLHAAAQDFWKMWEPR